MLQCISQPKETDFGIVAAFSLLFDYDFVKDSENTIFISFSRHKPTKETLLQLRFVLSVYTTCEWEVTQESLLTF